MLKKQYRLKNKAAFLATYNRKHVVSDSLICAYFGREKNDSTFPTRFAFVVSKKIHKRAVIRNRIRRLMRENIRLMLKDNGNTKLNRYMSVIFVAKNNSINATFNDIHASVNSLLKDA